MTYAPHLSPADQRPLLQRKTRAGVRDHYPAAAAASGRTPAFAVAIEVVHA